MQPLTQIHQPIPKFDSKLSPSVTRFFNHLKPNRAVVRYNWSVVPSAAFNLVIGETPAMTAHTELYFRTERQTLLRLPQSRAVVFVIRIQVAPLAELPVLSRHTVTVQQLIDYMDALPLPERDYKRLDELELALKKYRV